jgi:transcriptional regulator with XRE-family HTH domain
MYIDEPRTILNGARVRTLRQRLQLTQQELGAVVGCYQQYISALERGLFRAVRTPTLSALAAALGVEITELVVEEPAPVDRSGAG